MAKRVQGVQSFGGAHSRVKLDALAEYLQAFNTALKKKDFVRYYIDLFAGSGGHLIGSHEGESAPAFDLGDDAREFLEGSARRALQTEPPFRQFIFSDLSKRHSRRLAELKREFPDRDIAIRQGDANKVWSAIWKEIDWRNSRAVLFLDPYGAQVEWTTLEQVARTGAVDLWYLFPTGAVLRMVPRDGAVPVEWSRRLTSILGTEDWKSKFFQPRKQVDLFDNVERQERVMSRSAIEAFVIGRLRKIFPHPAAMCLPLLDKNKFPAFSLFFAAANSGRGGELAKKLAEGVMKAQRRSR